MDGKHIDLTPILLEQYKKKPRDISRFNVSDCWAIIHGYTSPQQFLEGEKMDFPNAFRCWQGTWKHNQLEELLKGLGYEVEVKLEHKTPNFTLVGKVDAIKDDTILEIKTSTELLPKAKSWHEEQVKIYLSLFKKEKGIIVQPIITNNKLILKEIGIVRKDDIFFKKVLGELEEFNNKLKETLK